MACTRFSPRGVALGACVFLAGAPPAQAQSFQYSLSGKKFSCYGWAVSRIGDVDRDGYEDFIVGAPAEGSTDVGAAYVISGLSGTEIVHLTGSTAFDWFGGAVE